MSTIEPPQGLCFYLVLFTQFGWHTEDCYVLVAVPMSLFILLQQRNLALLPLRTFFFSFARQPNFFLALALIVLKC